jgi:hypothetical protein
VPPEVHEALDLFLGTIQDTPSGLSGFGGIKITKAGLKKLINATTQSVWFDRAIKTLGFLAAVGIPSLLVYRWAMREEIAANAAVRDQAIGSKVAVDSMTELINEDKKRLATATPEEASAIIERAGLMADRITDINESAAAALAAAKKVGPSKTFWVWAGAIAGAALLFYVIFPQFRGLKRGLYRWPAERRGMQQEIDKLGRSLTRAKARAKKPTKRKKAAKKPAKKAAKKKAAPQRKKARPGLGGKKPRARARLTYKK